MTSIPVRVEFTRNPVTRTDVKITPVYWATDEEDAKAFSDKLSGLLSGYFVAMWDMARHDPKEIVVPDWSGWKWSLNVPKRDETWIDVKHEMELIADGASHRLIRVLHGLGDDGETQVVFGRDGSIACTGGWEPVIEDGRITRFRKGAVETEGPVTLVAREPLTPNQVKQLQDALRALEGDPAWKRKVIVLPAGSKVGYEA